MSGTLCRLSRHISLVLGQTQLTHRQVRTTMSLFPRLSTQLAPARHELGPFFNLFNDTFSELQRLSDSASRTFVPKFDVKEMPDKYVLEGELPGIDQKDVTIEFSDDQTLTIKGRTERFEEESEPPAEAKEVTHDAKPKSSDSKEVTTSGPKEVAKHESRHTYWVSERSVGEFARSFAFPNYVDQENVKASLKDGVLSVTVPKAQREKLSKKIQIE
jgi:HSP20 family protein